MLYSDPMAMKRKEPSEEAAASIRMYRERLAEIEEQWKFTRAAARANLIKVITEEGVSVATAALVSGNDRRTITVWLQIHNAEEKARENAKR